LQNLLWSLNSGDELPSQVTLDEYLAAWFDSLWRLSVILPIREHGAALVEANGQLRVAAARPGTEDSFELAAEEMAAVNFVGYYHTHPYASGTTGVAFSTCDLVAAINCALPLTLVQSGDDLFMMVRTAETPERLDVDEVSELETEFDDQVTLYGQRGVSWVVAIRATNRDLCLKYGLAFYAGRLRQGLRLLPISGREEMDESDADVQR
jgi:hypothetical protein